jgi:DNA mismatch repair protein MutS2
MIETRHRKTLELGRVLEQLAGCTSCDDSRALALAIEPETTFPKAVQLLSFTQAAYTLTVRYGYPTLTRMTNCAGALRRADLGSALTLRELMDISVVLHNQRMLWQWREQIKGEPSALDGLFECLYRNKAIEDRLNSAIVSEEELDDNASPALADIRRKIRSAGQRIRSQLDGMIRSATYQKYLQDPIVTMRAGRFVVPVKAEFRSEVKGLVHDMSSSGATVFIEPISVVELNNEIRVLENKEKAEIERILAELSALVGTYATEITSGYNAAVELDLYFAKSHLADRMRASVPTLVNTGETILHRARHPMIPIETAVPIDIALGKDYDTLVITGPNTGGKTVAIKTLGLLTLMAQCGLLIPASDGSIVNVYDQVFADIGDEQSIEQSLSTFSAHMTNIIRIVEQAGKNSLALFDELCSGTDPVEGAALAVSIIETLRKKGTHIAATTHYAEIKMYALETDGVENASCEFDVTTLRPTYRLLTGVPGRSNAFQISERLGLDLAVIEEAKQLVSTENTRFEDIVSELEKTRQSLEHEREEAQKLRAEAEAMRAESKAKLDAIEQTSERELARARQQVKRMIEETRIHADILFEELETIKKERNAEHFNELLGRAKQDYRSSMKEIEEVSDPVVARQKVEYKLPRPLEKGDIVYVRTLGKEGIVLKKPEGQTVLVQAGILKTSVPISEVELGEKKKTKPPKNQQGRVTMTGVTSKAERSAKTEIDLRGLDAEQAIMELDAFIDGAVLSGIPTIRIIHGKGTGVLRAAVTQHLRKHRSIQSFRLGQFGEGESGVTIAELK